MVSFSEPFELELSVSGVSVLVGVFLASVGNGSGVGVFLLSSEQTTSARRKISIIKVKIRKAPDFIKHVPLHLNLKNPYVKNTSNLLESQSVPTLPVKDILNLPKFFLAP